MSDLKSKVTGLSPEKRELLERRYREREQERDSGRIGPRSSGAPALLSFGQQRLWFLNQWEPGSPAYNISRVVRVDGPLDITSLERSLTEVVRRHETLRTTYPARNESAAQIIHPPSAITVRLLDLTSFEGEQQDVEVVRLAQEEDTRRFDLVHGPVLRAVLLRLHAERHVLILSMHHIASDGWSLTVLYRELFGLYESFIEGQTSFLPELPIQYADFAAWQRPRLQGERLQKQLSYWREQLKDLATLNVPADHPRPPLQTFTGASYAFHLPSQLVDGLKALSRSEGATLFMKLLAAFQALLHRYTGQDDIVVASPIAGRTQMETEGLIGFFVNMLVLRADTSGDPAFLQLLQRVQKVALQAYDHQEIPFEKLVEELRPPRDSSRNPLFQVVFALQSASRPLPELKRLKLSRLNLPRSVSRFDIELHLEEIEDRLEGLFIYNTSLFKTETIGRMAGHFRTLLEGIVADPNMRLSDLPLLAAEEKHQLLHEWNATETDYPRNSCIHEIFEVQAESAPDAPAVAYGAEQLTYRQLNEQSNRLAHHLRRLGVGPDARVGVCMERSIRMIVGLLGILKAGGAYVPLDSSYPGERLAFMLEDANACVLLTEEKVLPSLPETRIPTVCLDRERFDEESCENFDSGAEADSLACVFYTSGSTGKPKGVSVPHRAVARLVINTNYVDLTPEDRIAQVSTVSFDAATFEIWGSLLNGAALIVIPQAVVLSPRDFAREIRDRKISTLFLTTALFNQIATAMPAAFETLRYMLFGGEACDPKCAREVLRQGPPQHLINIYGPTESTTFATSHDIKAVDEFAGSVPIGRPISNTRVYILDRYGRPVPIGVVGELFIGGDGLAREYLNRPELTLEKFRPDPFSNDPAARLYRTGDFARYGPDGNIEFIGRIDQQVKIRGFRIELQEIEAALAGHPQISETAVLARKSGSEKRLVAYLVPATGSSPSPEELQRFLRERLPEYMVPSAFVTVPSFPLTPNGKLDHAALPDPGESAGGQVSHFVEPRSPIEKELARIWTSLLRVKRVGIRDNFFDRGGHSLLAIQLMARIERQFGKILPVAVLFESPTIEQLAAILDKETEPRMWSSLIAVQPSGARPPFFWIHGDWSNAALPGYLGADQPIYGLEHQAEDGRPAIYTEVATIAKHYLNEVRTVCPGGPYFLGGFSFGALLAFEMAQQLRSAGEEVALLFMLDPTGERIEHRPQSSFWSKIGRHRQTLAGVAVREKLLFILPRLRAMLHNGLGGKITKQFRRLRWKICLLTGRTLPPSVRSPYILDVYRRATRSYVPRRYSGDVTIYTVRDCTYLPPTDWINLITGKLEVLEGPGGHMDMREEPFVALWAERLKAALDRSQTVPASVSDGDKAAAWCTGR